MSSSTIKQTNVRKKHVNKALTIPEVFDLVREADSKDDKVYVLRQYRTRAMEYIVNGLYNVDWSGMAVPKVELNHRHPEICYSTIHTNLNSIETAYNHHKTSSNVTNRLLTRVLEEVSAEEARLLMRMFSGKKIEGISKAVFKEAYPEFFLDTPANQQPQA